MKISKKYEWLKYLAVCVLVIIALLATVLVWHVQEEGRSNQKREEFSALIKMAKEISECKEMNSLSNIMAKYDYNCKYIWDNVLIYRSDVTGQDRKYILVVNIGFGNGQQDDRK